VRWFHTGGIFAALSPGAAALTLEAVKAARKHGTIVSYDLNYRPSLWKSTGGPLQAEKVNREIAQYVDVMIGLGFENPYAGLDATTGDLPRITMEAMVRAFPNFKVVATTLRQVISATQNDWRALLWHEGKFYESRNYERLEILDRVGGGDSFASGLQFGFLGFNDPQKAVDYGAAYGALASTTPGDTPMATRRDIENTMNGGSARVRF
jgi:2-dehydro-3-deoxygluconokinase